MLGVGIDYWANLQVLLHIYGLRLEGGFECRQIYTPNPYTLHPFDLLISELDNLRDYPAEPSFIARNIQHYGVAGF